VIAGAAGIGVAFKAMRMKLARGGNAAAEVEATESVEDDLLTPEP
jgi:hypothetical protein